MGRKTTEQAENDKNSENTSWLFRRWLMEEKKQNRTVNINIDNVKL